MADQEEEKGFEVVDKRKVTVDESGEVTAHPEADVAPPKETPTAEEEFSEPAGELPAVDVYSLLAYFIGVLGAQTWQWLGLAKNPVSGQMGQDLEQAKVAIDAISALAAQLEAKLTPSEAGELKNLLNDLRINFVQQSSK